MMTFFTKIICKCKECDMSPDQIYSSIRHWREDSPCPGGWRIRQCNATEKKHFWSTHENRLPICFPSSWVLTLFSGTHWNPPECTHHYPNYMSIVCYCHGNIVCEFLIPSSLNWKWIRRKVAGMRMVMVCKDKLHSSVREPWQHNLSDPSHPTARFHYPRSDKFPNDTQHHRICKRHRQKHKFNAPVLYG